jgi:hypothetical protein
VATLALIEACYTSSCTGTVAALNTVTPTAETRADP